LVYLVLQVKGVYLLGVQTSNDHAHVWARHPKNVKTSIIYELTCTVKNVYSKSKVTFYYMFFTHQITV